MLKHSIVLHSLGHAIAVLLYITGISYLVNHFASTADTLPNYIGMILVLMLLTLSVAVMAVLVFGRPVYLYLDGRKKEAVKFLLYTIAFMIIITVAIFGSAALFSHKYLVTGY